MKGTMLQDSLPLHCQLKAMKGNEYTNVLPGVIKFEDLWKTSGYTLSTQTINNRVSLMKTTISLLLLHFRFRNVFPQSILALFLEQNAVSRSLCEFWVHSIFLCQDCEGEINLFSLSIFLSRRQKFIFESE